MFERVYLEIKRSSKKVTIDHLETIKKDGVILIMEYLVLVLTIMQIQFKSRVQK